MISTSEPMWSKPSADGLAPSRSARGCFENDREFVRRERFVEVELGSRRDLTASRTAPPTSSRRGIRPRSRSSRPRSRFARRRARSRASRGRDRRAGHRASPSPSRETATIRPGSSGGEHRVVEPVVAVTIVAGANPVSPRRRRPASSSTTGSSRVFESFPLLAPTTDWRST